MSIQKFFNKCVWKIKGKEYLVVECQGAKDIDVCADTDVVAKVPWADYRGFYFIYDFSRRKAILGNCINSNQIRVTGSQFLQLRKFNGLSEQLQPAIYFTCKKSWLLSTLEDTKS